MKSTGPLARCSIATGRGWCEKPATAVQTSRGPSGSDFSLTINSPQPPEPTMTELTNRRALEIAAFYALPYRQFKKDIKTNLVAARAEAAGRLNPVKLFDAWMNDVAAQAHFETQAGIEFERMGYGLTDY